MVIPGVYVRKMEDKREEIYERIPWETIENPRKDQRTLVIGLAAAVVAGALVYSFMSRPAIEPTSIQPGVTEARPEPEPTPIPVPTLPPVAPAPTTPSNISEADLYAVAPETLRSVASAHAEWFVIEYLSYDGSSDDANLRALLPGDIPLPSAPPDTLVFVEWVGAMAVEEVEVGRYRVEVVARYMVAPDGQTFQRVPPEVLVVDVVVDDSGPHVTTAPAAAPLTPLPASSAQLAEVPTEIAAKVSDAYPGSEIVGGKPGESGWMVVILNQAVGGVIRPESVLIP